VETIVYCDRPGVAEDGTGFAKTGGMFKRILIPLDGSPTAEAILPQVGRILTREDAEVILFSAVRFPPSPDGTGAVLWSARGSQVEQYMEQGRKKL